MTTYSESCSRSIAESPIGALDKLSQQFRQWMKNQQLKFRLTHERRQLLSMSDDMLKDIGISRADAELEAASSTSPPTRLPISATRAQC